VSPNLLFVYGTLRSEFNNQYARLLRKQAALVGRATVSGSIYRIRHYPGYRTEPAGEVHGELYELSDAAILETLDDYEGSEFERVTIEVKGAAAWIYQFKEEPAPGSQIESGDFLAQ
jgi:gamma-glutamylcyclotransferase (GGCT)/AIG2-like uncharacterized protein YtfP